MPASPVAFKRILRGHAGEVLQDIPRDIETPQTAQEQVQKSRSQVDRELGEERAASIHGHLRHISGFTRLQLASEYRALRATVFRLWMPHIKSSTRQNAKDMMRFNEAKEQAPVQSVATFSQSAERTRDTFLAMLGYPAQPNVRHLDGGQLPDAPWRRH